MDNEYELCIIDNILHILKQYHSFQEQIRAFVADPFRETLSDLMFCLG